MEKVPKKSLIFLDQIVEMKVLTQILLFILVLTSVQANAQSPYPENIATIDIANKDYSGLENLVP